MSKQFIVRIPIRVEERSTNEDGSLNIREHEMDVAVEVNGALDGVMVMSYARAQEKVERAIQALVSGRVAEHDHDGMR